MRVLDRPEQQLMIKFMNKSIDVKQKTKLYEKNYRFYSYHYWKYALQTMEVRMLFLTK